MRLKIITFLKYFVFATLIFLGCGNIDKRKAGIVLEEEVRPKRDVIFKNGYRHFDPELLSPWASKKYIFPVPQPNAVGTVDEYRNGITFIEFDGGKREPETRVIAQNFSKSVYGQFDYRFSPNFSDDMIVYSKTRVAVIANVKTGEAFHAGFRLTSDDYMLGIRFLDPENNLLVVVKTIEKPTNYVDNLHIARIDGKRLVDLGEIMPHVDQCGGITPYSFQSYNNWLVHDRKILAYDAYNTKNMLCFNALEKITHPFAEVFNRNKDKVHELRDFVVHPTLPLGFAVESHYQDWTSLPKKERDLFFKTPFVLSNHLIRWNTDDPDEQFTTISPMLLPLASLFDVKHLAFAYPSFSPDGKWLVLGCFKYNLFRSPYFIAIPVDSENPSFLNVEKLVVLGQVSQLTSIAWSTAPTSLVVADGYTLYKWNLEEIDSARVITVPAPDSGNGLGMSDGSENENEKKKENVGIIKRIVSLFRKNGGYVA